ncbi:ImpB/MucB/SamB family protein [Bifidobacterium sp. DSM 109958]|uniref:ImpB/MucB/SamB family protein n=1 Tax=Bifidobacterium moraviense TaxID=2675323 RepID=A0A7Y0F2T1_9BIFI|nr:ImpB/MucB/SamB family protein [Bifidobacterium sp. DSM 109958]
MAERTYLAIDLKSFYASAECAALGLDPLTTNLVVADVNRTEKTICLAVSPSLKACGLPGRARLFEVVERMRLVNEERRLRAPGRRLSGTSWNADELAASPSLKASYLAVRPRMAYYMQVSADIYGIYLRYASPEDIHVYSIDEVFIDVTRYLRYFGVTAHELARMIVGEILARTGITATAGIGTNLYLAKVAMDIVAKHMPADADGVRVAELDEESYRRLLWAHRPLTDFWRVGRGYARRLDGYGLRTMGDIVRCSLGGANDFYNADLLYRLFGVNAELLIDHAWGREPCTMADIKAYRSAEHSVSSGQVLHCAYPHAKARLVVREMADALALDLVGRGLTTGRICLFVGYDRDSPRADGEPRTTDWYGRSVPKPAGGYAELDTRTSSGQAIVAATAALYDRIVDPRLMVRRITVTAGDVRAATGIGEDEAGRYEQPDLFSAEAGTAAESDVRDAARDHEVQRAMLAVRDKFGRNAVLRGMNLEEGATGRDRNEQIGGHAAGDAGDVLVRRAADVRDGRYLPAWVDAQRQIWMPLAEHPGRGPDPGRGTRVPQDREPADADHPSGEPPRIAAGKPPSGTLHPTDDYRDVMDAERPRTPRHPPMSRDKRAAQFMPFAALTGYESVLERTAQDVERRYLDQTDPMRD